MTDRANEFFTVLAAHPVFWVAVFITAVVGVGSLLGGRR